MYEWLTGETTLSRTAVLKRKFPMAEFNSYKPHLWSHDLKHVTFACKINHTNETVIYLQSKANHDEIEMTNHPVK